MIMVYNMILYGIVVGIVGILLLLLLIPMCLGLKDSKKEEVIEMYKNKGYADLKIDVADAIIDELAPIQEKVNSLLKDKKALEEIYKLGAEKANYTAIKTLRKMQKKIGLIPR